MSTVDILTSYLEETKDAVGVLTYLRQHYEKSLSTYVSEIRRKWFTVGRINPLFKADRDEFMAKLEMAEELAEDKAKFGEAKERALSFFKDTLAGKAKKQSSARARSFTGMEWMDKDISRMRVLPDYVEAMRLSEAERRGLKKKARESLQKKGGDAWVVKSDDVLNSCQLALKEAANPFQLACALSVSSGRRMVEIFKTGTFLPCPFGTNCCYFSGKVKTRGKDERLLIPLLIPFPLFAKGLRRLREAKPCGELTNKEVNQRYSNSCNTASKRFLGVDKTFHSLRSCYAVVTFHACKPHRYALNTWITSVLGHGSMTTALHYMAIQVEGSL
ncbi:unnamed protein product, partial [Chrysoparadoxa australica]